MEFVPLPVAAFTEYKPEGASHARDEALLGGRIPRITPPHNESRFEPVAAAPALSEPAIMATTTTEPIVGAPGETGLLFALSEPAPEQSPIPSAEAQSTEASISGPEIASTEMASAVTGIEHVHTDVVLSDEAPTTPVAPQVVITDDGREWPEQSARLGLA